MSSSDPCRLDNFDFDAWHQLYQRDPVEFEARRQACIQAIIDKAPPSYQFRLKGLMFRIDAVRHQANNPLQACVQISQMMWRSTGDLRYFVEELGCYLNNPQLLAEREQRNAKILRFGR